MAKAVTLCLLFIFSSSLSLKYVVGKSDGLTIKLIHRDLPESPFYRSDLTYTQRMERLVKQSKACIRHRSALKHRNSSNLGGKVDAENCHTFMAQIGVGSFLSTTEPFKSYYFEIDTGSSLTWLECKDCRLPGQHCFSAREPFPDDLSASYHKLLCHPPPGHPRHPLCDPQNCLGQFCGYELGYVDGSSSKGFLAKETFTFETTSGARRRERVSDLVFGCGIDNKGMHYEHGSKITGILGLGWGASSFVNQLGPRSQGKFSYCLPRIDQHNLSTFLHFGANIPTTRAIYSTKLFEYGGNKAYYVKLTGISAAGTKLNIPKRDFARKPNGTGGCVIDSGTAFSNIPAFAYEKLKQRLVTYFSHIPVLVSMHFEDFDFCYKNMGAKEGFRNLPMIIFHFQGANLQLEPESSFVLGETPDGKEYFCLAILDNIEDDNDRLTTIGAYQQTNHRFVFLTRRNKLEFGPENCGQNA